MDKRIKQLESDIATEVATGKSKYALKGFARSTDQLTSSDLASKKGAQLIQQLLRVIQLEDEYRRSVEAGATGEQLKGLSDAIAAASGALKTGKELQKKRVGKLSQEIAEEAGIIDSKIKTKMGNYKPPRILAAITLKLPAIPQTAKKYDPAGQKRFKKLMPRNLKEILPN